MDLQSNQSNQTKPIKRLRLRYNVLRERNLQWCYYSSTIFLVPLPLEL